MSSDYIELPVLGGSGGGGTVPSGGTGATSFTPYAVITGGTTSTGALQNVAGTGTVRQLLTSAGAGALPGFVSPVGSFSTKTTTYPMVVGDYFLNADASGGAFPITLPSPAAAVGLPYQLKKIDSTFNVITITHNGAETIDGAASVTLNTQYECIWLVSDGTNWTIMSRRIPSGWIAYSPTIGATTTAPTLPTSAVLAAYWKREGDSMWLRWEYTQSNVTNATSGTGDYLFPLPIGVTAASATINTAPGLCGQSLGSAQSFSGADAQRVGAMNLNDASNLKLQCNTSGTGYIGAAFHNFNGATVVRFGFEAVVPITGWGN